MPKKAVASDKDRFDELPDDLLRRILYFLPGDDALQTCVLATRWREIWRRTTRLSFVYDGWSLPTCERFHQLVKLIIQLRGNSPLTYCQINPFTDDVEDCTRFARTKFTRTEQLIEYFLKCQVERLVICSGDYLDKRLPLDDRFISRYLRTIKFELVDFEGSSLDFSDCPALEELTMRSCNIYVCRIVSESLKHLQLIEFCFFPEDYRIQIYAPRLISLQLGSFDGIGSFDGFCGFTPLLEKMPLLETASVTIAEMCRDFCESNREDFNDPSCTCCDDKCVLLNGLSNAVHLKLTAEPGMFIYRWDLAWCPIFGKLKTLILNEWFTATDLVCILQHTPVLKKLTLKLHHTENFVGGSQETIEQPIQCACLLAVKIECGKVGQGVRKILKILSTCGILDKQISIKEWSH